MQQGARHRLLACFALASAVAAADTVVLRNGFRLEGERCEASPRGVRLVLANGGWIAVPAEAVARVESRTAGAEEPRRVRTPGTKAAADTLAEQIDRVADDAGLPRDLLRAVVWAESGFRQEAVSPKGAVGLMQLMPATAAELGVDPARPSENLEGGTRYLRQLLERFDGNPDQLVRALAAYNAGPGRVDRYGGVPPYPETTAYVAKIVRRFLNQSDGEHKGPAAARRAAAE